MRGRPSLQVGVERTTNSVLMAHQNGVTVARLVDSSFIVSSFTVLAPPLHGHRCRLERGGVAVHNRFRMERGDNAGHP